ncbi:hypothetical protein ABTZ57_27725 [Streptomyces sp. NPDC094048]|uniref:hypothetical protein n=1 Tax=Streptomyces sp. NPDC094048 TaxID=3155207 RepID=UPI00331C4CC3
MTASQTDRFRSVLLAGSVLLTRTFLDPGLPRDPWVTIGASCSDLRTLHVTCRWDTSAAAGSSRSAARVTVPR